MTEERTEGICLKEIPYLGKARILKVFSPSEGMLTFMVKKKGLSALCPFCIGEWVYQRKTGEIYPLLDGSLIDPLLELRKTFPILETAGTLAQDLLRTQLPGKSAPEIYVLALSYLQKISKFSNLKPFLHSFRLKLLDLEGCLRLSQTCCKCEKKAVALSQGESLCEDHMDLHAIHFETNEWQDLFDLAYARQFSHLDSRALSPALLQKLDRLFSQAI